MKSSIKILLFIVFTGCLTGALASCGLGPDAETTGSIDSIYESDCDNDGRIDSVYHYTYDLSTNEIKVEIDSDNDGEINKVDHICLISRLEETPWKTAEKTDP